ncbi:hypothetical protein BRC84_03720 [Halobacteriales archaeon QS_1_68_44]|nr:MAG: hypothetical protein BRC84_03720 [Halobacteriales archaeon QS_1_68_44]
MVHPVRRPGDDSGGSAVLLREGRPPRPHAGQRLRPLRRGAGARLLRHAGRRTHAPPGHRLRRVGCGRRSVRVYEHLVASDGGRPGGARGRRRRRPPGYSAPSAAGRAAPSLGGEHRRPDRIRPPGTVAAYLAIGVAVASPFLVFGQIPTNNGVGVLPPRSPLGPFLVIYAGLVTVFALYVLVRGWPVASGMANRWVAAGGLALLAAVAATVVVLDFAVLAVLGPLVVAGWLLVRTDRAGFAVVLLVAGAGLLLSFELIHARIPQIDNPRWNTSLKVAVQGWTLGAAGAGAAVAVLLTRGYARLATRVGARQGAAADGPAASGGGNPGAKTDGGQPGDSDSGSTTSAGGPPAAAWAVVVCLVVAALVASAVFPVLMFSTEVGSEIAEDRYDPSVDGLTAAERFHADEYDALRWLKDRPGHPTIVEAPGASYRWTGPAATYSGLPSVVGWDHQEEYRSPEAYERRVDRVDAIYTGEWADAARHLERYDVTYVYVGPNEQERYGSELRSFDREAFSVAFEGGAVIIYEVDHSELSDSGE